jgi:hypothetical protein
MFFEHFSHKHRLTPVVTPDLQIVSQIFEKIENPLTG